MGSSADALDALVSSMMEGEVISVARFPESSKNLTTIRSLIRSYNSHYELSSKWALYGSTWMFTFIVAKESPKGSGSNGLSDEGRRASGASLSS